MAIRAGKDVMCEKPTYAIAEGRRLTEVVAQYGAVFQGGIEDRSVSQYHRMAELARNECIGELQKIHVQLPAGNVAPLQKPAPVPNDLNYDLWLGPAPYAPYSPARVTSSGWRHIWDYGGGPLSDWGPHQLDTAQVANFAERTGPVEIEGTGTYAPDSMCETPATYKVWYRYANGVEMTVTSGGTGLRFEGTKGWVGNSGWRKPLEASSPSILSAKIPRVENRMWARKPSEHRNFLDCVKTRQPAYYCPEELHRLSTVGHLGNISIQRGRRLHWNPDREVFEGDDMANAMLSRTMRAPWGV
jgi:predicted dehydrogenase